MAAQSDDSDRSPEEAARLRDETIKRMIATPPQKRKRKLHGPGKPQPKPGKRGA